MAKVHDHATRGEREREAGGQPRRYGTKKKECRVEEEKGKET